MPIRAVFCVIVLASGMAGFFAQGALAMLPQGVDAKPRLRFNTQHFVPFSYQVGGVVRGPIAEIIQRVCDEAQIDCTMASFNWDVAQKEVKDGRADGLFVLGWSASRAKWLNYTDPVLRTEYGLFARTDAPARFNYVSDLKGLTIAVYGPSNTSRSLERIKRQLDGRLNILLYPDSEGLFKRLAKDRAVQAVYSNKDVGNAFIERLGLGNIRYLGRHRALCYYIGISKRVDVKLFDKFNLALGKLERQGSLRMILEKYGIGSPPAQKPACSISLRAEAGALTDQDIAHMRRRTENLIYNAKQLGTLPCDYEQRFQPFGSGVLMDNAINTMWQNSNRIRKMSWKDALAYIAELNQKKYGGYANWRLPTSEEFNSIIKYGVHTDNDFIQRLAKVNFLPFWSADKEDGSENIWAVDLVEGIFAPVNRNEILAVIAVRSVD